jgi:hypothetical protein
MPGTSTELSGDVRTERTSRGNSSGPQPAQHAGVQTYRHPSTVWRQPRWPTPQSVGTLPIGRPGRHQTRRRSSHSLAEVGTRSRTTCADLSTRPTRSQVAQRRQDTRRSPSPIGPYITRAGSARSRTELTSRDRPWTQLRRAYPPAICAACVVRTFMARTAHISVNLRVRPLGSVSKRGVNIRRSARMCAANAYAP